MGMVSRKCWFLLVLAIVLGFPVQAARQLTVGFATKSAKSLFWVLLKRGAQDAAFDLNVKLIVKGPPREFDLKGQLAVIDTMLAEKVDALVIAPCDSKGVIPAVKKARKLNIPVIAVDTAVVGSSVTSFIATNNITAAESAADWIANQLKGTGRVVIINGMLSQQTGRDRRDGFVNFLKRNYPGIEVIKEIQADWDPHKAEVAMKALFETNIPIDAVFCTWDDATGVVARSLEIAKHKNGILLVGFDGAPNALKLLKKGKVDADVAQFPYKMGYQAIKYAIYAAKGKRIPDLVYTDSMVVTRDNLNEFLKKAHMNVEE